MRLATRVRNRAGEILMDQANGGALLLAADPSTLMQVDRNRRSTLCRRAARAVRKRR
jgi:hypothetical protein